ncbi:UDP-N-acetylmuramoyl-L-alanyl-D-glutamate--2, 6-diaminopimelate ligase [Rubrobacter xylanophilus DSM 9941]|nr:UDP-N-acetylmuramoyl-L-alanyl-D-glutamate--2, 6-diaminopimelate ligase [Rubrobacter xylanophilus DSM 9941]
MVVERDELERVLGVKVPAGVERIFGVTHDSREVGPGFAFVAVPGFKRDGVEFVPEALGRGAMLVVAEREVPGAPVAVVSDARAALARLACAFYGHPSRAMEVYGVTGTNGKTTTCYALHAVLEEAFGEGACGLTTTAEVVVGDERRPAVRTTPEATEVQAGLAGMRERGVRRVVMEVSSHGIALRRVEGIRFAGAIFTNLSRDHLDLHGSMEEYYRTKRKLFLWAEGPKLVGADDAWGRRLAGEVEGVRTFGFAEGADYRIEDVRPSLAGMRFVLRHGEEALALEVPLFGDYNVQNAAGAAAFALELGVEGEVVSRALRAMPQVPGRFERVGGLGFEVIVDYAHTEVGLEAVLRVAREVARRGRSGRVICVFGAAGERDGAKRPLMGRVASRLADWSFITTDDAYSEDPGKIAREVAAGVEDGRAEVVLDRREAIRRALWEAEGGDVVVVAGKGHERVQHLPEGDVPFHDATVIREILEELASCRERTRER